MAGSLSDRLSGWKEIALHLHRSVRSVQRWERELGLPVKRVKTPHGHVIYADKQELDAWMARLSATHDLTDTAPDAPDDSAPPAPVRTNPPDTRVLTAAGPPPAPPARRSRWLAPAWSLAGIVALTAAIVAVNLWRNDEVLGQTGPLELRVNGTAVEAWSGPSDRAWTYDFGQEVRLIDLEHTRSITDTDLDGNGTVEYLVPVRFNSSLALLPNDALMAFSHTGERLWTVRFDEQLSCGGTTYQGPWQLQSVTTSTGPGPKRIWVAFSNHTWWPSVVIQVSPDGTGSMRYVQAGWVVALSEWELDGRPVLVAGGVINEHANASLAFLDATKTAVEVSPSADPRFTCAVEGAGQPLQITLFPRNEIGMANGNAYGLVRKLSAISGLLRTDVDEGRAIAQVDGKGHVQTYVLSDVGWAEHAILERAGRISHTAQACPERNVAWQVRVWRPAEGMKTVGVGQ